MIRVDRLVKKYENFTALNSISFSIGRGSFFGLLGPNGAGKTTFVRILSSLTRPTSGEISIEGRKINRNNSETKRRIGIVSQHITLERELSVYKNLELQARLFGIDKKERHEKIMGELEFADLVDKKEEQIKNLSGGMKRKLMIVKAMIHKPSVLVMDEPTVGLDVASRRKIWDYLKKLHMAGTTIILTTHYIEEAEHLCDRVALLNRGNVVALDTVPALIQKVGLFALDRFDEEEDKTITYFFNDRDLAVEEAKKHTGDVKIRNTNLEDAFVQLTSERVVG